MITLCTLRRLLHVFPPSPVFCFAFFSFVFRTMRHFVSGILNCLLCCSQVFFKLLISTSHHVFLELILLLVGLWPPSSPFLLPFPRKGILRNFILLNHRVKGIMIPRVPYFDVCVDVSFVGLPPWPEDVVQRGPPFLPLFSPSFCHCLDWVLRRKRKGSVKNKETSPVLVPL